MTNVVHATVTAAISLAVRAWALVRRLVESPAGRRAGRAEMSPTRRRFALGAISRQAFDTAMRKKRRPSRRRSG